MNDMESQKFEDAFKRAFEEAGVSPSDNVWANIERTMDDMESRKFGGAFQQAFGEAGVSPSENVWTNIELDLMKAEGGRMKRRLVFFQLLAAASIAFALGVAGIGYYMLKDQELTGAAGQLAYQDTTAGPNANTSAATATGDPQQTLPSGASTTDTDTQQTEQGSTGIAPVAAGQDTNAAHQEQTVGNAAGASNVTSAGDTQTRKATVEIAGTTAIQGSTVQPGGTDPQHARARQDAQRRHATDARNTDSSTDRNSMANRGRTAGSQQTLVATNDAGTTSNAAQQQTLADVTTQSGTTKTSGGTAQNRTGTAGAPTLSENDQQQRAMTNSAGRIDQKNGRLAQVDETGVTHEATVVASGSQRTNNASSNNGVTADVNTTTLGTTTPAAGQAEYRLAYSPVPSEATPVVTSLGARVQKPASMKVEPASTVDPLVALLARLDEQEKDTNTKDKKDKRDDGQFASEKLWTSVGFAAGSFNTINSSVSNSSGSMMMADARKDAVDKVANQQANASGSSYSVGVSLGTRISSRWVLQGGVNYMTQASDYTASSVGTADYESFQAPSVNSIMSADKQSSSTEALSNVVPTAPYNVNNSLQFVSVPLQAGYLLVNRKVGVQLNGGLSTDLFIQNTITPDGDNLEKETKGNGTASPYRTVNFSGLVGTELSYRFSQHYRLALNPGLRYPLNSIYKSDQPVTAAPLTFDIGLRFRYIFH